MWWIKFWIQRLSRVLGLSIFNTTTKKKGSTVSRWRRPQSCFPKYSYEGLIRRNWEKHPTQIGLLFSKESISQQVKQINFSSPFNIKTLCFWFLWLRTKNRISTWQIKNWAAWLLRRLRRQRLQIGWGVTNPNFIVERAGLSMGSCHDSEMNPSV